MKTLEINYSYTEQFLNKEELEKNLILASKSHDNLLNKTGKGSDFLGWLNLPNEISIDEIERIKKASVKIRNNSNILVVVGIGGSYLGAKAIIEALQKPFDKDIEIIFAGNSISGEYMSHLLDYLDTKDFSINVISKSGTTTEPAIAFRILKQKLEDKYGKIESKKRIFVTTDKSKGALKVLADSEGYEQYIIPDDVGGRYSVLTPVGLLPIAVAGIDIEELILGARDSKNDLESQKKGENTAYLYSALRNTLYKNGKSIELLVQYEPSMMYFNEWYKQLFGESDGKENKGIFPASVVFSTDLHSMGQYIQEGLRIIFETVVFFNNKKNTVKIPREDMDLDNINYIAGKSMDYVNAKAMEGTIKAHAKGQVPNILINVNGKSAYSLGYLVYFFELSCAINGYILDINPFDQPGVEEYKKNMFRLLEKPNI